MNSCFIFLGNTTTLHRFIVQVECSSNRCWQGKCSDSIHFSDRVIIHLYKWKLAKGILVDNQRSMQCCCFSSELISSLCPWNFKLKLLYFSDFCVHLCVNLMFSPCMQLLTSLLVVLVILYCLLLLLVILLCFMQVRCIVRNIVRDWAEEVIFCSTLNSLKQSSFPVYWYNYWKYCCFFSIYIFQGQKERDECYKPILEELNHLFPNRSNQR